MHRTLARLAVVTGTLLISTQGADAYIGPGAGISAIGTVVALLAALVLGAIGFVWYPTKRLCVWLKARRDSKGGAKTS